MKYFFYLYLNIILKIKNIPYKISKSFKFSRYYPYIKCRNRLFIGISSRKKLKANHSIADPKEYQFGAKIALNGYSNFYVEER